MQGSAPPKGVWPIERMRVVLGSGLRPYLVSRFTREVARPRSLQDWVRFAANYRMDFGPGPLGLHFSLQFSQVESEIVRFLEMVSRETPQRVLEVGSLGGGTLFLFARVAAPDALLIGMDLPAHDGGGLPGWCATVYERGFASPGQRVRVVRGDSHSEATRERVKALLGGAPLDLLFIDGDHSYGGVKRDFELYAPLVRPGGIIGIHDIVRDEFHRRGVRTKGDAGEVFRFWDELKNGGSRRDGLLEIVEDPTEDGYGIGVVRA